MGIETISLTEELSPGTGARAGVFVFRLPVVHVAAALCAGFLLRMFFVLHFPYYTGDTKFYEELARNWLDHGVYGIFVNGQLMPVDMRVPGYPAFLAAIYAAFGRARIPVMIAQVFIDLGTCVLAAFLAGHLAPGRQQKRIALIALWLTALCPFTAMYTAVPLTETLATFLTTLTLLVFVKIFAISLSEPSLSDGPHSPLAAADARQALLQAGCWLSGGLIVGLGTLVRPETPLLLLAAGIVAAIYFFHSPARLWSSNWRGRRDWRTSWRRLLLAGCWMAVGLVLPLLPWATRNARTLGRIQFLAPRYAESYGDFIPRGFFAWTKTWMWRYQDAYSVPWKLGNGPIEIDSLPEAAFDSPDERSRVAQLLAAYNHGWRMTPLLDRQFDQLANERTTNHPLRPYVAIPFLRVVATWLTPRVETLRYTGQLWPLNEAHHNNPVEFDATLGLWLLNCLCLGLAAVGAWRFRRSPVVLLITLFVAIRTAVLTQMQTVEPRYVLECFPALLVLAALCWATIEWKYFHLRGIAIATED